MLPRASLAALSVRASMASAAFATAPAPMPRHLIVLVHGLGGAASDLSYLASELRGRSTDVLVHNTLVNEPNTRDGVAAGSRRLAADVRGVVAAHQSLVDISFVGNSLGGLYARHCLADLASGTTVATLQPRTFLTIATPHLGIRRHTFVPMPQSLVDWGAGIFAGLSGSDLALRNDLVYNMAVDDAYTRPLSLFAARRAYANVAGDFLVPLATAAFIPTAEARPELAPAPAGAPDGVGRIAGQLTTASATCAGPAAAPRDSAGDSTAMEVAMASSLDALGWTKVFVEFPGQIVPLSHNKICAQARGLLKFLFTEPGKPVIEDMVDNLVPSPGRVPGDF